MYVHVSRQQTELFEKVKVLSKLRGKKLMKNTDAKLQASTVCYPARKPNLFKKKKIGISF